MPNDHVLQSFEVFLLSSFIKLLSVCQLVVKRFQTGQKLITFFFRNLDLGNSRFDRKRITISTKLLVCGWNLLFFLWFKKPKCFCPKTCNDKFFLEKSELNYLELNILWNKYFWYQHKWNKTKAKSTEPKHLKTLNMVVLWHRYLNTQH